MLDIAKIFISLFDYVVGDFILVLENGTRQSFISLKSIRSKMINYYCGWWIPYFDQKKKKRQRNIYNLWCL